jgi:hypothetical protein
MDNKENPKSLKIRNKKNMLVQVYAHTGTHVEQASRMRLSVSAIYIIMKSHPVVGQTNLQGGTTFPSSLYQPVTAFI